MGNYTILSLSVVLLFVFGCTIPGLGGAANVTNVTNATGNVTNVTVACQSSYEPVCGNDGVTYNNSCLASTSNVSVASAGPCKIEEKCTAPNNSCSGSNAIQFYCDNSILKNKTVACGIDYNCVEGNCVKKEQYKPFCTASNPDDVSVKGTVTTPDKVYEDICTSITNVKKYNCLANLSVSSSTKTCPLGFHCQNGSCVNSPVTCTPSDKTGSEYVAGTVRVDYGTNVKDFADSCYNETTVLKYSCSGSNITSRTVDCPHNSVCDSGVCTNACWDTDGGTDVYVSGKVVITTPRGDSTDYRDECSDPSTVKEYFCNKGAVAHVTLSCGSGVDCFSGGCIKRDTSTADNLYQN